MFVSKKYDFVHLKYDFFILLIFEFILYFDFFYVEVSLNLILSLKAPVFLFWKWLPELMSTMYKKIISKPLVRVAIFYFYKPLIHNHKCNAVNLIKPFDSHIWTRSYLVCLFFSIERIPHYLLFFFFI